MIYRITLTTVSVFVALFCIGSTAMAAPSQSGKPSDTHLKAIQGRILDFNYSPIDMQLRKNVCTEENELDCDFLAANYFTKGMLIIDKHTGLIVDRGSVQDMRTRFPSLHEKADIVDFGDSLIMPGFTDCHLHAPQIDMIGKYGSTLSEWLLQDTYPSEALFSDKQYAEMGADRFLNSMLKAGTTSANIYSGMFLNATETLFEKVAKRNMRVIAGLSGMTDCAHDSKVYVEGHVVPMCMSMDEKDSNSTKASQVFYENNLQLIKKFHQKNRHEVGIMPRWLHDATPMELEYAQDLLKDHRKTGLRFHTHAAENLASHREAVALFKEKAKMYYTREQDKSFLSKILACVTDIDVFNVYGLVSDASSFAHAIHMTHSDWDLINHTGASVCACPSSNLFLGSGLFDFHTAFQTGTKTGLGTDIGAGTSISLVDTLNEAYKVAMFDGVAAASVPEGTQGVYNPALSKNDSSVHRNNTIPYKKGQKISSLRQFYFLTLGTATQLGLHNHIGTFEPGKEADFIVLDTNSSHNPLLQWSISRNKPQYNLPLYRAALQNRFKHFQQKYTTANVADMSHWLHKEHPHRHFLGVDSFDKYLDHQLLSQELFQAAIMGNEALVEATFVLGELVYLREANLRSSVNGDYRKEIEEYVKGRIHSSEGGKKLKKLKIHL
eukprot:Nk52_evm15s2426 gene=Nk52_evmTU15s2426